MKTYLTFLISVLGAAVAFSQPTIPVNNVSPVAANSLIGKIGTAGRGQSIPIGSGLAFVNGVLVATGGGGGGSGTVTSIPDGSTNGVIWTVATRTTTPTFTFSLGAITPTSILASGAISAGTTVTAGTTFIATGAAAPSTTTAGQFGFDTNAWSAGRGALQVYDGTAPTYLIGVLASDTPLNGQFPRWNTGGTITWETPSGTGNVSAAGTLTSGDIVTGQGGTAVATSSVVQIAPGEATVNGNLTVTGNQTIGNLTTTNLTISGTITGVMGAANGGTGQSTYTKGDILAAAAATTLNKLAVGADGRVLTANSTATNGISWEVGTGGTVTVSGTPTSGQLAEWTSATDLQGVTASGTGVPARVGSPAFTGNITLANGASPTTGAVAVTAFDTDAWAASRGAVQVNDGTANTFLVGTLASDTPSNGQVPTWNTGGTITWEDSGSGSGTVNSGTANQLAYYASAGTAVSTADGSAQVRVGTASTAAATGALAIYGSTQGNSSLQLRMASADAISSDLYLVKARGTMASPAVTQSGDTLGRLMFGGFGNGWSEITSGIKGVATSLWSAGNQGSKLVFMATVDGDITRNDALELTTGVSSTTLTPFADLIINPTSTNSLTLKTNTLVLNANGTGTTGVTVVQYQREGATKSYLAVAGANDHFITGSVVDDTLFRTQGTNFIVSTDSGTSIGLKVVASTGQVSAEKTTASTSPTTGALISKGGLGVAGNVHVGGDVEIADIGEGVIIKSPDGTRYRLTVANGGTLVITGL